MEYRPRIVPQFATFEDVRAFLQSELDTLASSTAESTSLELRPVYKEPVRPREGMIVFADGVKWDPGSGRGAYEYSNAVWVKL